MALHEVFNKMYEGYDNVTFLFERIFIEHTDKKQELVYRVSAILGISGLLYFRMRKKSDSGWLIEDTTNLPEWMKDIEDSFRKSIELNEG